MGPVLKKNSLRCIRQGPCRHPIRLMVFVVGTEGRLQSVDEVLVEQHWGDEPSIFNTSGHVRPTMGPSCWARGDLVHFQGSGQSTGSGRIFRHSITTTWQVNGKTRT